MDAVVCPPFTIWKFRILVSNKAPPCISVSHALGGGGYTVVVGEKHLWVVLDGTPDPLVYVSARLQKYANVLLQQPRGPAVVDRGQLPSRKYCKIGLVLAGFNMSWQQNQRTAELLHVDYDFLAFPP